MAPTAEQSFHGLINATNHTAFADGDGSVTKDDDLPSVHNKV